MVVDRGGAQRRAGRAGAAANAVIICAAISFIVFSASADATSAGVDTAAGRHFACTVIGVEDGDGPIDCAEFDIAGEPVSVRVRGIDAREADDSCQHPDTCPEASGAEAKAALTRLAFGRLDCTSFGPSHGRVNAICRNPAGADISCEMVRSGAAVRWAQYDPGRRLIPCLPPQH